MDPRVAPRVGDLVAAAVMGAKVMPRCGSASRRLQRVWQSVPDASSAQVVETALLHSETQR